jgi:hypothetical protein
LYHLMWRHPSGLTLMKRLPLLLLLLLQPQR